MIGDEKTLANEKVSWEGGHLPHATPRLRASPPPPHMRHGVSAWALHAYQVGPDQTLHASKLEVQTSKHKVRGWRPHTRARAAAQGINNRTPRTTRGRGALVREAAIIRSPTPRPVPLTRSRHLPHICPRTIRPSSTTQTVIRTRQRSSSMDETQSATRDDRRWAGGGQRRWTSLDDTKAPNSASSKPLRSRTALDDTTAADGTSLKTYATNNGNQLRRSRAVDQKATKNGPPATKRQGKSLDDANAANHGRPVRRKAAANKSRSLDDANAANGGRPVRRKSTSKPRGQRSPAKSKSEPRGGTNAKKQDPPATSKTKPSGGASSPSWLTGWFKKKKKEENLEDSDESHQKKERDNIEEAEGVWMHDDEYDKMHPFFQKKQPFFEENGYDDP